LMLAAKAESHAKELAIQRAVNAFQQGAEELRKAIDEGPRLFFKGSTPEEIDVALELCFKSQATCERVWYEDEAGVEVEVAPFFIDLHEVTLREFDNFVEQTGYQTTAEQRGYSYLIMGDSSSRSFNTHWNAVSGLDTPHYASDNSPVLHMSYQDAEAFCAWRGMRLPTESEWEFAASGGGQRLFAWGDEWQANLATGPVPDSNDRLLDAVDSYGGTPEGLWGITGGVWEWTSTSAGESAFISKGGAWSDVNPAHLRINVRRAEEASYSSNDMGFRCATSTSTWNSLYRSEP